jgi:hypothetical protein
MIPFSVNGRCGYPLEDALEKLYTGLEGRDDKMFVGFASSVSVRVEVRPASSARSYDGPESCSQWPAYGAWTKQVSADFCVSLRGH